MRLSNGFVIDKEKTFGELKFTAVRDVFLQNEDGTPSTQLKKRIYDLKCICTDDQNEGDCGFKESYCSTVRIHSVFQTIAVCIRIKYIRII